MLSLDLHAKRDTEIMRIWLSIKQITLFQLAHQVGKLLFNGPIIGINKDAYFRLLVSSLLNDDY